MYRCSSITSCNGYDGRRRKCTRCCQDVSSYYVGKRLSQDEKEEANRIMNEEDNINWVNEYAADKMQLKKMLATHTNQYIE